MELPQADFNAYFYALMTSTLFAVFGFFVCFGPLMAILSFTAIFVMVSPTLTTQWFIASLVTMVVYIILFLTIVRHSPNSFTFGEAGLITQIVGYVFIKFIENIHALQSSIEISNGNTHLQFIFLLFGATSTTIIILSPILYCKKYWCLAYVDQVVASISFYLGLVLNLIFVFVPAFVYFMKADNILMWLLQEITKTQFRLTLIAYWFILTVISFTVTYWFSSGEKHIEKTVIRKIFHGIAFLIFLPAYKDVEFVALVTALILSANLSTESLSCRIKEQ